LTSHFSDFRHVDPFQRHLRSKWKAIRNLAKFWTFFALPNCVGGGPYKICTHIIIIPRGSSPGKVLRGYSTHPKVIGINTLNFKLKFKCSPIKCFGDPYPQLWCGCMCVSKHWSISSECKNLRGSTRKGRNSLQKKSIWVGPNSYALLCS